MDNGKTYQKIKIRLFLAETVFDLALLAVLQFSGFSGAFISAARMLTPSHPLSVLVYLLIFFHFFHFLSLPFRFYDGYLLEKRFHLSRQTLGAWVADDLKKYALSLVMFLATMGPFLWLIARFPHAWWLAAAAGWFIFAVVISRLFPVFIVPLFYPLKPLPDGPFKERLAKLCGRFGVRLENVYEIALSKKTVKANAAVVGMGRSRRVLIGDTLLKNFSEDEIEMVVAHELGHTVKKHILKSFIVNLFAVGAGFYLLYRLSGVVLSRMGAASLADPVVFPALVFLSSLGGLAFFPAQNWLSRRMENEADRFALGVIPSEPVFSSLMKKLGELNLADTDPDPWTERIFYSHPSIKNRLAAARRALKTDDAR